MEAGTTNAKIQYTEGKLPKKAPTCRFFKKKPSIFWNNKMLVNNRKMCYDVNVKMALVCAATLAVADKQQIGQARAYITRMGC